MLGHADIKQTQRYLKRAPSDLWVCFSVLTGGPASTFRCGIGHHSRV
jgi:hypothetical protein